ncbi:hypothetical protein IFM89_023070 [Coptis chinensis]|uniref:Uncharacterized protein n=1 Tax=Coptis chinensis TaxID=261450 RepID=A0A835IEG8_9MAGN|nr:hypothetical protein IFM89_023070 [Coptis chinensis]
MVGVVRYWPDQPPQWANLEEEEFEEENWEDCRLQRLANHISFRHETEQLEEDIDNEDATVEERRQLLREIFLQRHHLDQEHDAYDEEEYDEEEDEEEDEVIMTDRNNSNILEKPVYVPKTEWDTLVERGHIDDERCVLELMYEKGVEERKAETKQIVAEFIRMDQCSSKNLESKADDIVDDIMRGGGEEDVQTRTPT